MGWVTNTLVHLPNRFKQEGSFFFRLARLFFQGAKISKTYDELILLGTARPRTLGGDSTKQLASTLQRELEHFSLPLFDICTNPTFALSIH